MVTPLSRRPQGRKPHRQACNYLVMGPLWLAFRHSPGAGNMQGVRQLQVKKKMLKCCHIERTSLQKGSHLFTKLQRCSRFPRLISF